MPMRKAKSTRTGRWLKKMPSDKKGPLGLNDKGDSFEKMLRRDNAIIWGRCERRPGNRS